MLSFCLVVGGWVLLTAWAVTLKSGKRKERTEMPMDLAAYRRRQSDGRITPEEKRRIINEIMRRRDDDGSFQ